MSAYNVFGKLGIQIKAGEVRMDFFNVGDPVDIPDGIYLGYEGAIVIKDGIFVAEFESLISKWGDNILPAKIVSEYNPVNIVLREWEETHGK